MNRTDRMDKTEVAARLSILCILYILSFKDEYN